ncbi:Unsaturated glucuronyl hydrolase [Paenibacillus allorhizoplanae]|uniref:Unsaturated glucuronyl hydrolase n=1 Tax=Paenibacillus allorhizoplanae TaxID=2905648 RepID=A0ABN8GDM8_9BACL|nr:glycoside hydrolase family 88 protein [Paenibacillus allorhizoplanae]CAH1202282.1 Unsaturated glucuronyl hydrolase [Paenibacillus allorhizoplanae]
MQTREWIEEAWAAGVDKVRTASQRIGARFPHGSHDGEYQLMPPVYWTAGFWTGLLWLVNREHDDKELRQIANQCEAQLDDLLHDYDSLSHDLGFMWTLSSIANWQTTNNEFSKRRAMVAASHLAGRFNINGRFIRAWNQPERTGWAIIDCLMNMPLLYWASEQTGDPRFKIIAEAHTMTAAKHFMRKDGSIRHVICFDPVTGVFTGTLGGQGFSEDSAWSRGASWGIYGWTLGFKHTQRREFLWIAERAADFFLGNLPDDHVPYWDFYLPSVENAPRDSSAAAIAASGLLDLADAIGGGKGGYYREQALAILESLTKFYRADESEEAILLYGTGNLPMNQNVNRPLIYGDYYYMEALAKLRGKQGLWGPWDR